MSSLTELERQMPWVKWREPLPAEVTTGATGLVCRVCLANDGLKAGDVGELPQTREDWDLHFASHLP